MLRQCCVTSLKLLKKQLHYDGKKKKERRKRGVGTWFEKKKKINKPRKSRVAELPLHPKDFHFWHYNDSGLEGKRVWLRQNIIIKI